MTSRDPHTARSRRNVFCDPFFLFSLALKLCRQIATIADKHRRGNQLDVVYIKQRNKRFKMIFRRRKGTEGKTEVGGELRKCVIIIIKFVFYDLRVLYDFWGLE